MASIDAAEVLMFEIECPECGEMIDLSDGADTGEVICESCGATVQVPEEEVEASDSADSTVRNREKDLDDLIEIDLAADGESDGDLWEDG